jgi:hypothetical protein
LAALSKGGALFIQHLKIEARITNDPDGRLGAVLDAFRPKSSYQTDIDLNFKLAELAATYPNTAVGGLWAADVLYVALRNFGVLYLAQGGRYVFSYAEILTVLAADGLIDAEGGGDLLWLRLAKSLYRSGEKISPTTINARLARAVRSLPHFLPIVLAPQMPAKILRSLAPLSAASPSYHRLRQLECAYIALATVNPGYRSSQRIAQLKRWINNPRAYANLAALLEGEIVADIRAAVSNDERVFRFP